MTNVTPNLSITNSTQAAIKQTTVHSLKTPALNYFTTIITNNSLIWLQSAIARVCYSQGLPQAKLDSTQPIPKPSSPRGHGSNPIDPGDTVL